MPSVASCGWPLVGSAILIVKVGNGPNSELLI